jgi:cyclase
MEQVTSRIFAETKVRGCNPSYVLTSAGPVVIDTPQLPTRAVAMRDMVESIGPIQYLINTEHHVDHIFGNYWFKGRTTIVHHQGVHERFMTVYPELDPFEYALEALPTDDPDGAALVPDRETYYANMGTADIVFTGDLTLKVGDRTFHLLHTPGHTPGQVAVYVPEERAVFTGDTIFSECTTWLMTSDVDQWITALDRIRALDVDFVIPGHGPVQGKDYLATQRSFMLEWKAAVAVAVAKGWSREETVARVSFAERYPVDIGQEYMMEYIQERNAGALYDKLTAPTSTAYPAKDAPPR